MFKSFRWRIALWFVGLSSLVYMLLSVVGGFCFYSILSRSMDDELKMVASQIGHAIDLSGERPTFRDWLRVVVTEPARSVMSMQLFDPEGRLLERYGPAGIPRLLPGLSEFTEGSQVLRVRQSKLLYRGKLVGYLQLQLPAEKRALMTREFLYTMGIMAPFVLLAFGLCSYAVSGIAARPIEDLVSTLKRFVADAGHELNTPASVVRARAQSLESKLEKQGIVSEDLKLISMSAERMGLIVHDLMLLAELEAAPVRAGAASRELRLDQVVMRVFERFATRFESSGLKTHLDLVPVTIEADVESMERIVGNLMDNALKYTENGGDVWIALKIHRSEVELSVRDSGIGIPSEHQSRIFERFYRVDKSRSRISGGSGLGLAIVKALVEGAGGRVSLESKWQEGSTFFVYLPLHRTVGAARKLHAMNE